MKRFIQLIIVLVVFGVLWYFISPLFIQREVNEAFPEIEGRTEVSKTLTLEEAAQMPDTVMEENKPAPDNGPVLLKVGSFRDADSFHKGSGKAGVYELEDESRIVRFENFSVVNGPDLRVLLSKHPDDVIDDEYIELGKLKGNKGDQNYTVPPGVDVSEYESVIIYCKPFHVIFSIATFE